MNVGKIKQGVKNPAKALRYIGRRGFEKYEIHKFKQHVLSDEQFIQRYQYYSVGTPAVTVEYEGERNIPSKLKNYSGEYKSNTQYLFEINDGVLYPPNGVPVTADGKIIHQFDMIDLEYYVPRVKSKYDVDPNDFASNIDQSSSTNTNDRTLESAFPLGTGFRGGGYCHWFDETLPQLRLFEKYCAEQGEKPSLILPNGLSSWQANSLKLMGYTEDDYITWGDAPIKARKLLVPTLLLRNSSNRSKFRTNKEGIEWVADKIKSNVHSDGGSSYSPNIVISREDANERRVVNHNKLVGKLSEYGFESYTLAHMDFEEQVKMFKNAKNIIAPHGAGLVNTIFSDQANIIELFPESGIQPHYFVLSNELDHSYDFIICENLNKRKDMKVPIKEVVAEINTTQSS